MLKVWLRSNTARAAILDVLVTWDAPLVRGWRWLFVGTEVCDLGVDVMDDAGRPWGYPCGIASVMPRLKIDAKLVVVFLRELGFCKVEGEVAGRVAV